MPELTSLQIGQPRKLEFQGTPWTSAIYKSPVPDRLSLDRTNLLGDRQANRKYHGGPDKAVCCFPAEHYGFWQTLLQRNDFAYGAFGENFTVEGMLEESVCIGDIYAVGTARVQISQPRQPCINLARKWNYEPMPKEMIERGHTGFYLRVVETGEVGAGDTLELCERPHPDLTIRQINDAKYNKSGGLDLAARLANLQELNNDWRWNFRRRLPKGR